MLQSIKEHTQGWIAGVIVSLLILSFALWGISSYFTGGSANQAVVEVDGVKITSMQLSAAYERMRRQAEMQTGTNSFGRNTDINLKQEALQGLIDTQVLKQASINQGFYISTSQVDRFVESMPEFQVDGKFSVARLQQILAAVLYTPSEFLDLIKVSLLIDQPKIGTLLSSFSLPVEVSESISLINQEREIEYVVLPFSQLKNQATKVSDQESQSYYDEHKNDFKNPDTVTVSYLKLSMDDLAKKIKASDKELELFFNDNKSVFGASSEAALTFDSVKDKVRESYAAQKAQELFAEAREKLASVTYENPESLKIPAEKLGLTVIDSKQFTKDKGVEGDVSSHQALREVAFSEDVLELRNNSDVIQLDPNTAVVIRVKDYKESSFVPIETVRSTIIDKINKKEIEEKTLSVAKDIKQELIKGTNSSEVVKIFGITWKDVGFISRHDKEVASSIIESAFAMPIPTTGGQTNYAVTRMPDGYAIVALKAVKDGINQDIKEYDAYVEQVQSSQGILEYELYKNSLKSNAKIVRR